MLLHTKNPQTITDTEDGYILLAVLILVFFLLLSLSIAAPRVAREIQRDKEQEAVERGLQYQRAIKLYYKKFGSYPTDIKQLEKTNEIRFLRRRYTDPISGKDDWRIIHVGEAKVPPLGFFGEPLQGGLSSQSTGPGLNGPGSGGAAPGAGAGSTFGFNNSGSGSPGVGSGSPGIGSGSSGAGGSAQAGGFGNFGSTGQSGSGFGGAGFGGANGQPGQPGQGGFANGQPGQSGQGGFANGPAGQSNSTFGGSAPIVGVGIPLDKNSQRVYHKQKKYSQWEFVYDPQQDLLAGVGGGQNPAGIQQTGVATPGNANAIPNGGSGGFGFQNGPVSGGPGSSPGGGSGFGFGNGSGSGSGSAFGSSNPTPPPASPPQ